MLINYILFFLVVFIFPLQLSAKAIGLKELILSSKNHPELKIERLEIEKAKTLFDKIDGEIGPKISLISGVAPNKTTTGNPLTSTRNNSLDTLSYVAQIDFKWPLYMFNRGQNLKEAARGNLEVKELDILKKENELTRKVKEIYYGYQYTSSLDQFASEVLVDLKNTIEDFKKNHKTSSQDFEKLELFYSMAQIKKYEIEKAKNEAILGLKFISQQDDIAIEQDWIEFAPHSLPTLAELKRKLPETHILLQQANIGVMAKNAFLISEKKTKYPVFGIFSKFDWIKTQKSTKQNSKFANDPYNHEDLAIGVGLIWDFDFGVKNSKIEEAQVDLNQTKLKAEFAQKNLPLQIEKIYLELENARLRATELQKAYKTSKKILTKISAGVVFGLTPAKEIIESYTSKAQIYAQMLESFHQYETKLAELSLEVGTELDPSLTAPN